MAPVATNDDIAIREAEPGDLALLMRLMRALAEYEKLMHEYVVTEAQMHAALFGPTPCLHALVAELGGEPVGYAAWLFTFDTFRGRSSLFVEDVFVEAAHRGRGVGRAIFRDLARRALGDEYGRMEWSVLDWNAPSIEFYRGLGARPIAGWTHYAISGDALNRLAGI